MLIYRSFRVSLPDQAIGAWTLDSRGVGPYLAAMLIPGNYDRPVSLYRHQRLMTLGSDWGYGLPSQHSTPVWVFAPTADDDVLMIDNTQHSAADMWVTLVGVFGDWEKEIDGGTQYKASCLGGITDSFRDEVFIENTTQDKDHVLRELIMVGFPPGNIYNSSGETVMDFGESGAVGPRHVPIDIRLRPGEYLFCKVMATAPIAFSYMNQANYWEVPTGQSAPGYVPHIGPTRGTGINPYGAGLPDLPEFPPTPPWSGLPPEWPVFPLPPWPYPGWPPEIPGPTPLLPTLIEGLPMRDLPTSGGKLPPLPWKDLEGATSLIGIGPFRPHLLHMDSLGRVRTSDQATTYNSGQISKTDDTTSVITPDRPGSRLSLKAAALAWEVKVLTIYDVLRGRTFADKETIYLDASDAFSEPLEVVQVQVSCPGASGTSTGKIYYYIGV